VPVPADLQHLIGTMRTQRILVPDELMLPDRAAWKQLEGIWRVTSGEVAKAMQAHHELGKQLARAKFASGDFVRFPGRTSEASASDPHRAELEARTKSRHPDEWISTVSHFVDGAPCFDVARILPGERPELDAARQHERDMKMLRKSEIEEFIKAKMIERKKR
jgi:hypothetical protein